MGKAYSEDLRKRIVAAVEAGQSRRRVAELFAVSASCAVKLLQRWRMTGSVSPGRVGAPKRSKLDPHADWLLQLIEDAPDRTLEEVRGRLHKRGVSASVALIWTFFDRHGISFKKNHARQRAGASRRRPGARRLESRPASA